MERHWNKLLRRSLTVCGLIAFTLSLTGCQGMRGFCGVPMFAARICPTCTARTVDECRCFTAYENAGYNETTWTSLGRDVYGDYGPNDAGPTTYGPNYSDEHEAVPTPLLQPAAIGLEDQSESSSLPTIRDVTTASHYEYFGL